MPRAEKAAVTILLESSSPKREHVVGGARRQFADGSDAAQQFVQGIESASSSL